jgi:superoxide dismutase, Fe-Mn family
MAFELPPLPYAYDALEPHMSARTLRYHHDKHHRTYVETLNKLIAGTTLDSCSLEEIVQRTAGAEREPQVKIFNNAAQCWNHAFFWSSMTPKSSKPERSVVALLEKGFGGLDKFKAAFHDAAVSLFGSGYVWLVMDGDSLKIRPMADAMGPLATGERALLGCDVWEHAYYLDYQNERAKFIDAFLNDLVDWHAVAARAARPHAAVA